MCLGDIKSRVNDIQIYVDNKKKKGGGHFICKPLKWVDIFSFKIYDEVVNFPLQYINAWECQVRHWHNFVHCIKIK